MIGLSLLRLPQHFTRRKRAVMTLSVDAIAAFAADVRSGAFPSDKETYHVSAEVAETLELYGSHR